MATRRSFVRLAARTLPPLAPPSCPRRTAAGSLPCWRGVAVRLLPRRYVDNRLGRAGHCHGLISPAINLSPSISVAVRGDANSLIFGSDGYRYLILASASSRVEHPIT